jgi:hypothetical protein
VAALFGLLFVARIGGARRALVMQRWPAFVLAGAGVVALMRGAIMPAAGLGALAGLAWVLAASLLARRTAAPPAEDPADAAARAVLGLGRGATVADIRRAYRVRIARAHPDRGGAHADAARLTAARDHLLKGKRP